MSLQVWLPLNGNLNNNGVSGLTFSNTNSSNLTVNSAGKIGSCYTRATKQTSGYITSSGTINLSGDVTMCCWAYVMDCVGNTANGLLSNHSHASNAGMGITVKQISTSDYRVSCNTGTGSSRTYCTYYGTTNIKNAWHHLALTYNKSLSQLKLYVDGNVEYTLNSYSNYSISSYIRLFEWSLEHDATDFRPAVRMNDVRVYDNCLSSREIKEIAKGLVVHYPLSDPYLEGTTNTASLTRMGGWNNSGDCSRNYNDTSISNKPHNQPIYTTTVTTAGNCAQTFGYSTTTTTSKTLTCSVYCYLDGTQDSNTVYIRGGSSDSNLGNFEYNGSTNPVNWPLRQWIRLSKTITTSSSETSIYLCTYLNVLNNKRSFTAWQIEEKNHVTPYVDGVRNSSIAYDTSGFGYNGTTSGSLTVVSNPSPRNLKCCNFYHAQVVSPYTTYALGNLTYAGWVYQTARTSDRACLCIGGTYFTIDSSGHLSGYAYGKSPSGYHTGSGVIPLNTWTHLAIVWTDSHIIGYINGVQDFKIASTGTFSSNTPQEIGHEGSSRVYSGYMSDFRIYSTALSASDIQELYNAPISISSNGTLMTQGEFIEE